MSRYRDDDETAGGYGGGGGRGGRGGGGSEDRYESERGDYSGRMERPRVRDSRDYGYDDSYGAQQNRPMSGGGRGDYGQGRGGGENYGQREERYGQRGDYGADESRYGGSGYSDTGRLDERDDDAGGRSLYEEGRDYLQQRFGRRRSRAGRGGAR